MTKTQWLVVSVMAALCATSVPAFARGGGASMGHIRSQGITNSNGPDSADRDKGRARAADRAHEHGKSRKHMHSGKSK